VKMFGTGGSGALGLVDMEKGMCGVQKKECIDVGRPPLVPTPGAAGHYPPPLAARSSRLRRPALCVMLGARLFRTLRATGQQVRLSLLAGLADGRRIAGLRGRPLPHTEYRPHIGPQRTGFRSRMARGLTRQG
jgi:hypothetical protein